MELHISSLEGLDFADDIVLLSWKFQYLCNSSNKMIYEVVRLALKLNAKKCKHYERNVPGIRTPSVNNRQVENVSDYMYLVAMVNTECDGDRDIKQVVGSKRGISQTV